MSNSYDEYEDQAIARALDAEETDEAAMDRATLAEYQQVLAHLPFEEVAPPPELEDRVVEAALAQRPAAARSISSRAHRRATARWITLGAAVAAAAAVIAFMFATTGDHKATPGGRVELAASGNQDIAGPIRAQEGSREAILEDENGDTVGRFILAPRGDGALYDLDLPEPVDGQVLYAWLVADDSVSLLGRLTNPKGDYAVPVQGDVGAVMGVAISAEPAGTTPNTAAKPTFIATATFPGA
jgi:anti-sigma-K factor RskA